MTMDDDDDNDDDAATSLPAGGTQVDCFSVSQGVMGKLV